MKIFRVVEFLQFHSIRKIFILVDGCNIDKHLAFSLHVSGEPGIAGCSRRLDIYLRECGLARKLIHATQFYFFVKFSRLNLTMKLFNSKIFLTYIMLEGNLLCSIFATAHCIPYTLNGYLHNMHSTFLSLSSPGQWTPMDSLVWYNGIG